MDNLENVVVEEETVVAETVTEEVVATEVEEEAVVEEVAEEVPTSEDGEGEVAEFVARKCCSVDENGNMNVSFSISHEDIRFALYNLLGIYDEEDNDWYFVDSVYDDYFIFENWDGNKIYKQSYNIDGENVSLSGERTQMFKMLLTESEKLAVEQLRENYAALEIQYNELKAFKEQYDAAQVKAQKDEIFGKEEYSILSEDEAFKTLVADAEKFSVEEIASKAKAIFADHVIATGEFSAKSTDKKVDAMHFSVKSVNKENKKPYGGLFD